MKKILLILDGIIGFIIIFFIGGAIIGNSIQMILFFSMLAAILSIYFGINIMYRRKYYLHLEKQKESLEEENSFLEMSLRNQNPDIFRDNNDVRRFVSEGNLVMLLRKFFESKIILRNTIIPYYKKQTEIDIIMIHTSGIFVFESKNIGGNITGNINDEKWSVKYPNGKVYDTRNPIKQNRYHIDALRDLLTPPDKDTFKSFVVFSNRLGKLAVKNDFNVTQTNMCRLSELKNIVLKRIEQTPNILSQDQIKHFEDVIKRVQNDFPETKYKHYNKYDKIF